MEQHREECRDQRRLNLIDHLVQDLRYAFRILIKNPGFTGTAVIALAIGIGANVAMFSVVNSVLLRPLPYPSSDKLMTLWKWRFPGGGVNASPSEFLAWRNQSRSFSAVAAYLRQTLNLSGQGNPEQIEGLRVTADFFSVLRIRPARGRLFASEELEAGERRVAVISDKLSRTRMEGNEGGVGSSVNISGEPHLIIGILPASFRFGNDSPDLYLPLVVTAASRLGSSLSVIARLSPGMQREAAEAELGVIAAQMRTAAGEASQMNPGVVPLQTEVTGDARSLLLPLFGAIGCVLLIGCATLANLLLARATLRRKEMAVRAALGAGRMRLIGQMLTESVALSLVGGIAALALTKCLLMLLVSVRPKGLPRIDEVSIDPYVLGFALVISLIPDFSSGWLQRYATLKSILRRH